jgi:hypothetical protein
MKSIFDPIQKKLLELEKKIFGPRPSRTTVATAHPPQRSSSITPHVVPLVDRFALPCLHDSFFLFLNEIINCKSTDKLTLFLSFTPALPFNQVLAPKDTHGPPHHKPTTTTNKRLNALVKVCAKEKRVNVNVLTALPVRVAVDPRAPTIAVGTVSANHWRNLPVITHLSKPTSVWLV